MVAKAYIKVLVSHIFMRIINKLSINGHIIKNRLCKLGLLKKNSDSTWAAPTFIIPKKNGTVQFISDFKYLNKCLVKNGHTPPKNLSSGH